jgi:heptosyltransferase II
MTTAAATAAAASAIGRIFVRMPNWVGDVVMATPAIRALRVAYPRAAITLAFRGRTADVLRGWDKADQIWTLGRGDEKPFGGLGGYVRRLRAERFDLAVLLTNSLGTALGPALARIPRRAGYAGEGRTLLLTHRVPRGDRKKPVPMPRFYGRVLDAIGVAPAGDAYELPVRDEDRVDAERRLRELGVDAKKPLMLLAPGAQFGSSKLWEAERFAAVGDELVRRFDAEVLVLVGPGEESLGARVVSAAEGRLIGTHQAVIPLATLRAVVDRAALMVVNDTGPRFFAAALGVPLVCVMGSTHPGWTDWRMERQRVVRIDVPCGPCHLKTCPLDHACMTGVSPEAVLIAVESLRPEIESTAAVAAERGSRT